ncbi:hypothetical protein [Nannocystis punicea]|uniref:Uncharacterized protein n=1 Tax=Nannocystis punicea TaxID=2995304 RepID=A0ABY7H1G0_9BACT|nr:hypothetical protein [Nannocystis poenicansa]WAS92859.1 hypothetical protein O0S08_42350 [Nannocystis poenicansa]
MELSLERVVQNFADALVAVDATRVAHKGFQLGIGPWGESEAVRAALQELQRRHADDYAAARIKRLPDLLIPSKWAIEFKILRPFGDNGKPAEHWSENVLHPYAGNTSALGDCLKLLAAPLVERRAVVIFGFEHTPAVISLDQAIAGFELLAAHVLRVQLAPPVTALRTGLVHPVHQQLRVFGYEVLSCGE